MSQSAAGVAAIIGRKMQALEKSMDTGEKGPLGAAMFRAKRTIEAEIPKDAGGDMSLSNWRRGRPIKMGARYDFKGGRSGGASQDVMMSPRKPVGPMVVLTHGRRAGVSNRRRTRGRSYGATSGKGTWTRGQDKVYREIPRYLSSEYRRAAIKAFMS